MQGWERLRMQRELPSPGRPLLSSGRAARLRTGQSRSTAQGLGIPVLEDRAPRHKTGNNYQKIRIKPSKQK